MNYGDNGTYTDYGDYNYTDNGDGDYNYTYTDYGEYNSTDYGDYNYTDYGNYSDSDYGKYNYTVNVCRISHRIWKETKMHPGRLRSSSLISCCLLCLHFLCDILLTFTVQMPELIPTFT